jgi:NAD(P)-dependent dehydrogenase (short-subunit alcohol dehydrogenase family)
MTGRLQDRNAIVSGGAAGAGGAASEVFAREGAHVAIVDIQEDAGSALAEKIRKSGGKAFFVRADVSRAADVDAAFVTILKAFDDRIDVLFNHAGTVIIKPFLDTTETDWDRMMDINVKSMFLMTRAALPSMLAHGGGAIVNTSSISAVAGTPMEVLYCTSKGACHMFTRAIATEYRDQGIRCNAVCPGFIRTAHGLRELKGTARSGRRRLGRRHLPLAGTDLRTRGSRQRGAFPRQQRRQLRQRRDIVRGQRDAGQDLTGGDSSKHASPRLNRTGWGGAVPRT